MTYIATFYSHFGAIRFKAACQKKQIVAQMMPVPRSLSSSCGTCVCFDAPMDYFPEEDVHGEIEQIVCQDMGKYITVYQAKDSAQ